jgi:hypothetical protein
MDNFKKYSEFTNSQNWAGICELNGVPFDSFGTKKEIKILGNYLEPNEAVLALTSGIVKANENSNSSDFGTNTWLVVLTTERFLFLDCALLSSSVDTQTIRLDRVQAVSASQGWVLGKIMVDIGSRTIVIDNCVKATVPIIADLANKWLKELSQKKEIPTSAAPVILEESGLDKLKKLGELFKNEIISEEEFSAAKKKILASL